MPFSFVIVSLELDAVVDQLGDDGDIELDEADELGDVGLGADEVDEAVELGVEVSVVVVEDELLLIGGVAGIAGVVVVELDELVAGGVVVVGSIFCWQPTRAITAAAAAVRMKRFI